ncbi:MAG: hypothetical protein AAGA48_31320 [Myxococcota bacterium]
MWFFFVSFIALFLSLVPQKNPATSLETSLDVFTTVGFATLYCLIALGPLLFHAMPRGRLSTERDQGETFRPRRSNGHGFRLAAMLLAIALFTTLGLPPRAHRVPVEMGPDGPVAGEVARVNAIGAARRTRNTVLFFALGGLGVLASAMAVRSLRRRRVDEIHIDGQGVVLVYRRERQRLAWSSVAHIAVSRRPWLDMLQARHQHDRPEGAAETRAQRALDSLRNDLGRWARGLSALRIGHP